MAAMLLSAACRGKEASAPPAEQTSAGASLGKAEVALTGTPATAEATAGPARARPADARQATATSPAGAVGQPSPGRGAAAAVATPHPNTPDPCALVTPMEAEAALGGRPFPGQPRRSRDSAEVRCTYDYLAGGQIGSVVVAVWKGSEARAVYELRRSAYGQGATVEELRGLGDRAFAVKGDEGWVNVLKGDVYLSVQLDLQSLSAPELRTRAMAMARTAVGRL